MSSRVQRTYGRRSRSTLSSSSPPPEDPAPEPSTSSPVSTPPSSPIPKRSLSEAFSSRPSAKKPRLSQPDTKKFKSSAASSSKWKANPKKQSLIQLHFSIDASILRTCPICDLSYTKGAQDDEDLHKSHCARVQRGLEWTKDEVRESAKHGVVEIESGIRLKDGSTGRILAVNANVPGKIGSKVLLPPIS
jgi:N-acetyltransferase